MTDDEIINQALYYYSRARHEFACSIAQKSYRFRSGKEPASSDVSDAIQAAKSVDALIAKRRLDSKNLPSHPKENAHKLVGAIPDTVDTGGKAGI